jgi:hypothetical protein
LTVDRHQLFTLAWGQARKLAARSGTARTHIGFSLRICWAILKEATRKAALPARPNAYAMGAPAYIHADGFGWRVRSSRSTPIYNGW